MVRYGFGGVWMVARKDCIWLICAVVAGASPPCSAWKAVAKAPRFARSPRQCRNGLCIRSVSVIVRSGPFIGCCVTELGAFVLTPVRTFWLATFEPEMTSSAEVGSPRSQASRSVFASTWHEAQASWPRPELICVL